jgi:hypothetical protein
MIASLTVLNGGQRDYVFRVGESSSGYKIVEILDWTSEEGCYVVKFNGGQFEVRATNVIVLRIGKLTPLRIVGFYRL